MTCAKTRVRVTLTQPDGRSWTGENRCRNPQAVCPRAPGEDYTKCRTVCDQVGHAELDALAVAGDGARGSTASLEGHTYYCMDCQHALFKAGVVALRGPGARDTGLGDTPLQNGQTMAELAEIEREHFGDPDKGTGIYAAGVAIPFEPSEAQISAALEAASFFDTPQSRKNMRNALLAAAGIVPPGQEWLWPKGIPGVQGSQAQQEEAQRK